MFFFFYFFLSKSSWSTLITLGRVVSPLLVWGMTYRNLSGFQTKNESYASLQDMGFFLLEATQPHAGYSCVVAVAQEGFCASRKTLHSIIIKPFFSFLFLIDTWATGSYMTIQCSCLRNLLSAATLVGTRAFPSTR